MKTLKRMMVALLALLPLATGVAVADDEHGYSRIFIFGASFMDPGNHFALTGETAHPPFEVIPPASYGVGGHRFTNGRTWVEVLARKMELTEWAKPAYRDPAFGNYAVGYARARERDGDALPSLYDQVQAWIINGNCTYVPMDDTLFVVDSAYFDLADVIAGQDPFVVLPGMIESIATNIGILYQCGARNLLVAKMGDMGAAPIVPEDQKDASTYLTHLYNQNLQAVIDTYSGDPFNMNVSSVDFFAFMTVAMTMPRYFGFTNVTEPCVTPGVVDGAFCHGHSRYFWWYLLQPRYFWWDSLHPTKRGHALFAEFALAHLPVRD